MKKYNVIVVGGGFAGVAAAVSAARGGASVLLVEQANCLGGTATNCLVIPFMRYYTTIDGERYDLSRGIFREINEKMQAFSESCAIAIQHRTFSEEHLKYILQKMCQEAGVELLLRSYLIGAQREGDRVTSITVANKSGLMTLEADYFIDASGDADLTHLAQFPTVLGRPEDHLCQPMTLCFRLGGVDRRYFTEEKPMINALYKEFKAAGKIKNPREDVLRFSTLQEDIIHFNTTRVIKLDPTNALDLTKAELEAREQVYEIFQFLKANSKTFANSCLLSTAAQIGVRESRMICGEYTLNAEEMKTCPRFADSIALGNYDIDIHNPEGSGTSHYYFAPGEYYTIPYRCLIPKGSQNLLVAGRCISVTHEAQASIRIMPIVCCLGEAAGTAAAQAWKEHQSISQIDTDILRSTLTANGALC